MVLQVRNIRLCIVGVLLLLLQAVSGVVMAQDQIYVQG